MIPQVRMSMARSDGELNAQVGAVDALRMERSLLRAMKKRAVALFDKAIAMLDRREARLKKHVQRFYVEKGEAYFSPRTQTIKLDNGTVWSRVSATIDPDLDEEAAIERILKDPKYRNLFLRHELNRTAIKSDPKAAAKFGIRVTEEPVIIISTTHTSD